jgi:dipeptidyl aminopeptidase/acylaminoacyl peptidase
MSAPNDTDRLIHAFLLEGPAELSEPLGARIRGEIHETKQRAGFRPWRNLSMPRTLWVVAPLAAIVVAIGGLLIVSWGGPPAPSPTPTVQPSVAATAQPSVGPTAYPLAPGEAWIVIGGETRGTLIRSDGTDRHDILVNIGLAIKDPAWSPDGNQLVFEGNGTRGSQLYIVDADGTNRRQLTPTPDGCPNGECIEAVNPAWSHDGSKVAYIAPRHNTGAFRDTSLMVIDVASGAMTEVYTTATEGLARPTWSPDGNRIALEIDHYVGDVETSDIKDTVIGVIDIAASDDTPTLITEASLLAGYPVWHPTQDLIVFRTNRLENGTDSMLDPTAASNVYTMKSDGSGLAMVTAYNVGGQIARAPSWLPDGRILFTSHSLSTGAETLRVINVDGSDEQSATGSSTTTGQGRWRPGT